MICTTELYNYDVAERDYNLSVDGFSFSKILVAEQMGAANLQFCIFPEVKTFFGLGNRDMVIFAPDDLTQEIIRRISKKWMNGFAIIFGFSSPNTTLINYFKGNNFEVVASEKSLFEDNCLLDSDLGGREFSYALKKAHQMNPGCIVTSAHDGDPIFVIG